METVFSNLNSQDIAEITIKLREQNINYKVVDDGTGIQVDKKKADEVRIYMASQQLPRNSGVIGYEMLENISRFAPESERQMRYLQALQGEIRRNIELFNEVNRAQVLITLPKDSIYIREREPAKAAVTVFLQNGVTLNSSQITGIKHLVAHSVEGLTPDNVFLTDQNMRPLEGGDGQEQYQTDNMRDNMRIKAEFEAELQNSLKSLLRLYYGDVAVMINADLNFDRLVRETQLFDPLTNGERIIRSMEVLEEYYRNSGGTYNPGDGEIPYYPGLEDGQSEAEKRHEIINYEINQVKEHLVVAPGAVRRLSVAVMINGDLSEEERQAISDFVSVASGLDPINRLDQINVLSGQFASGGQEPIPPIEIKMPWLNRDTALILGTVLSALIVFGLLLFRRKGDYQVPPIAATTDAKDIDINLDKDKADSLRKLAKRNPDGFTKVLKTWLAEE